MQPAKNLPEAAFFSAEEKVQLLETFSIEFWIWYGEPQTAVRG